MIKKYTLFSQYYRRIHEKQFITVMYRKNGLWLHSLSYTHKHDEKKFIYTHIFRRGSKRGVARHCFTSLLVNGCEKNEEILKFNQFRLKLKCRICINVKFSAYNHTKMKNDIKYIQKRHIAYNDSVIFFEFTRLVFFPRKSFDTSGLQKHIFIICVLYVARGIVI